MAVTRRGRGSRSRAIVAAGLLAAAAISSMPARAADAPTKVASTVDTGWSNGKVIVASFDQDIRGTGTTAAVTNADGSELKDGQNQTINGVVSTWYSESFMKYDQIIWAADLNDRFDADGQPLRSLPEGSYKITWTAVGRTSGLSTTVGPLSFKVDGFGPINLEFTSPLELDVLPTGTVEIRGVVSDNKGSANGAFKSGVSKVTLYFYNTLGMPKLVQTQTPAGPVPTPQTAEVVSLRRGASLAACATDTAGCSGIDDFGNPVLVRDKAFSADVALGSGIWTIKAIATDLAGNQSGEVSVTFVKVAP